MKPVLYWLGVAVTYGVFTPRDTYAFKWRTYLAQNLTKVVPRFKRNISAFQNFQNFENRSSTARVIFILVRSPEIFCFNPCRVDFRLTFGSKSSPDRPFKAKEGTKFWIKKNSKLKFPKCVPYLFYDVYSCPWHLPATSATLRSHGQL